MHTSNLKSHLSLYYRNSVNESIACWQLLDKENHAVACAEFRNGNLERFDALIALDLAHGWLATLHQQNRNLQSQ